MRRKFDNSTIRQEYIDLGKQGRPGRGKFDSSTPTYANLLHPDDNHWYHTNWISDPVNDKAVATDENYSGDLAVTYGYACPMENGHSSESQHIYGTAFDFDAGSNGSQAHSKENYDMYKAGLDAGATFYLLYDQNGSPIETKPYPDWGSYPSGVTEYTRGHLDWR